MADSETAYSIDDKIMSTLNLDDGTQYIIRDKDAQEKIERVQTDLGNKLDKPINEANKQLVTDAEGNTVWENKPIEETEDDAIGMLVEMGIIDPVTDEEGNILTDENGNVLTI